MDTKLWWHGKMRVIQDNLQVMDTPLMDPEKIARETEEMHANVLVVNVGGIYAWYPSEVRYHHINEYLPKDRDLLADLISACHQRGIKVVARFDFSKTDDYVCQERPEWFVREPDGSPRSYGSLRPGNWSILYATCINSGYRNEEVAMPVLREVIDKYAIDGVFLNAPNYEYCCCEACQAKYTAMYGKPLPIDASGADPKVSFGHKEAPRDMDPSFPGICYRDNIGNLYKTIKSKAPDMPLILYYGIYNENLDDRLATSDMICTEAQDVLSRGWKDIPPIWLPTIIMKMGRAQPEGNPAPFGIIHSCPGMDWRHTGLPNAEYKFWLRQIPAAGGTIWHSITGFNDTVSDKRILKIVEDVNAEILLVEAEMHGAKERSDVLLLWNSQGTNAWAELLLNTQTQFDIRDPYQLTQELLANYPLVVLPDNYPLTEAIVRLLHQYVEAGGTLVVEGSSQAQLLPFKDILGISDVVRSSEALTAAYWRFEKAGSSLCEQLDLNLLLPHRGITAYTRALPGTEVLATLVPPFAPLNSVGSPPERASILVQQTEIPLCTRKAHGKGTAVMLPFQFAKLADTYRLADTYQLWQNLLRSLRADQLTLKVPMTQGLVVSSFIRDNTILVHLVNGVGHRPLMNSVTLSDVAVSVRIPDGKQVSAVEARITGTGLKWDVQGNYIHIKLSELKLWEMLAIQLK